jgi:hypothetical protein
MTEFDLDRLGSLWRQDPEPAEIERLRQSARKVSRRARLAQAADAAGTLAVSVSLIIIALVNRRADATAVIGTIIAFLFYSSLRNRKLRELEVKAATGSTQEMLDQAIARGEGVLKRIRANLVASIIALPLMGLLLLTLEHGPGRNLARRYFEHSHIPLVVDFVILVLVGWIVVQTLVTVRNTRREVRQLRALREAFQTEEDESQP